MKRRGSVEAVIAALRDECAAELERIDRETAAELDRAPAPDGAAGPADGEARLLAARRQARERLAREDWADARTAIEAREAFLRRAAEAGLRALAAAPDEDRRAFLQQLADEGARRLGGAGFTIAVAPRDAALLPFAVPDPAVEGGCIVRAGNRAFDNTLRARAARFEPRWRAALGKAYWP